MRQGRVSRSNFKALVFGLAAFALLVRPTIGAGDDAHYIQSDDVFFVESPRGENAWVFVFLGKVLSPATPESKGKAQLLRVTDGRKFWTSHFWRTRPASSADLKIGTEVIALDREERGVYRAPKSKDEARKSNWYMAVITDISELGQGFVTVSGGYRIHTAAIRVEDLNPPAKQASN